MHFMEAEFNQDQLRHLYKSSEECRPIFTKETAGYDRSWLHTYALRMRALSSQCATC